MVHVVQWCSACSGGATVDTRMDASMRGGGYFPRVHEERLRAATAGCMFHQVSPCTKPTSTAALHYTLSRKVQCLERSVALLWHNTTHAPQ